MSNELEEMGNELEEKFEDKFKNEKSLILGNSQKLEECKMH
jgi:hypothetical protein